MVLLPPMVEPKINCQLKIKDRDRYELGVSNCTGALLKFCVPHRTEAAPDWRSARLEGTLFNRNHLVGGFMMQAQTALNQPGSGQQSLDGYQGAAKFLGVSVVTLQTWVSTG